MDTEVGRLLDALRGVQWPTRRPVHGGIVGTHHSRLRGAAPELAEYRSYRQGDEARRIDWRVLARTDRAYIRLAPDRATLRTAILVDASASMAFPAPALDKWHTARLVAVGLASVAQGAGDPVGLVISGVEGVRIVAPSTRRGVVNTISRTLSRITPAGAPSVLDALRAVGGVLRVVLISDFLSETDSVLRWIRARAVGGGIVHAVHVVAREEVEPPPTPISAVDPEAPGVVRPFDERASAAYVRAFGSWREDLARSMRSAGADYTPVVTGESVAHAVRRIVSPSVVA